MQSLRIASQLILLNLVLLTLMPSALAAQWSFQVTDRQNQPLEDAVILLPGDAPPASTGLAIMDQQNKSFVPYVLVIGKGQMVNFPNSDNIRHHVYSFSPAKPFEIRLYAGVPEQPLLFDTAGIVVLGCNIHDGMVGYIVVADTMSAGKTDAAGKLQLQTSADAPTLRIWHPRLSGGVQQALTLPIPPPDAKGVVVIRLDVNPAPAAATDSGLNRFRQYGR